MIYEKLVFNDYGNLLGNCPVNIILDGIITDFSPVTSNEFGTVTFDAPEGEYEVSKIGEQNAEGNKGGQVLPEVETNQGESISRGDLSKFDKTVVSDREET